MQTKPPKQYPTLLAFWPRRTILRLAQPPSLQFYPISRPILPQAFQTLKIPIYTIQLTVITHSLPTTANHTRLPIQTTDTITTTNQHNQPILKSNQSQWLWNSTPLPHRSVQHTAFFKPARVFPSLTELVSFKLRKRVWALPTALVSWWRCKDRMQQKRGKGKGFSILQQCFRALDICFKRTSLWPFITSSLIFISLLVCSVTIAVSTVPKGFDDPE